MTLPKMSKKRIAAMNVRGVPEGDKSKIYGTAADWLATEIARMKDQHDRSK